MSLHLPQPHFPPFDQTSAAASLQITYTDSYPEVAPEWELIDLENVTEDQQAELSEAVQQAVGG